MSNPSIETLKKKLAYAEGQAENWKGHFLAKSEDVENLQTKLTAQNEAVATLEEHIDRLCDPVERLHVAKSDKQLADECVELYDKQLAEAIENQRKCNIAYAIAQQAAKLALDL